MSAHTKKQEIPLPSLITADDEWNRQLKTPGLKVIDIFAKWAGPCEPMQGIFKRYKTEYGENLSFVQAQTDYIEALKNFKDKSCPTFLVYYKDILVKIIQGANAPLIEKSIKEQMEITNNGGTHKPILLDPNSGAAAILSTADGSGTTAQEVKEIERSQPNLAETAPAIQSGASMPQLSDHYTETFALIKPDAMYPARIESILEQIRLNRFHVMKKKKIWMTPALVEAFYAEHKEKPYFHSLVTYFTSGACLAMVLAKDDAVAEWRKMIGPTNPNQAKEQSPQSLRATFGTDNRLNAVFGSDSQENADKEIKLIFADDAKVMELPLEENELSIKGSAGIQRTICIIQTENEQIRGDIIDRIICRGITIAKREEIMMDMETLRSLFPKEAENPDVFQEYINCYTKCMVLVLGLQGENVVKIWHEIAGPKNPEEAKVKGPCSIRALYGKDSINNGVYAPETVEEALYVDNIFFPHTLQRTSTVLRDSRVGTAANPYPIDHQQSAQDLHARLERTVALIKPDALAAGNKDAIIKVITDAGFTIIQQKEILMTHQQAQSFYSDNSGKPYYDDLVNWISGSVVYAMVLEKDSAITSWRELIGPTSSVVAKEMFPQSLRALYGTDSCKNAVHGSDSPAGAQHEMQILFGQDVSPDPAPLEGQVVSAAPVEVPRTSVVENAKAATKSAENILNMILGDSEKPGSKANLVSEKAGSKANLTKSASGAKLSNSRPTSARNSSNQLSGSKTTSKSSNALGSKGNLVGSKNNLAKSKSKLGLEPEATPNTTE